MGKRDEWGWRVIKFHCRCKRLLINVLHPISRLSIRFTAGDEAGGTTDAKEDSLAILFKCVLLGKDAKAALEGGPR